LQQGISINKYISQTGRCSRREADKLIEEGRVMINNRTARKGNRVNPGDDVIVDGERIKSKRKEQTIIALHKPKGITCTTDQKDPSNIIDYINYPKRIFPIGRLDKDSTGLILLTNDGDIVNKILRVENQHDKEYIVTVDKTISQDFINQMASGVPITKHKITDACKVMQLNNITFKITLQQGLNRQIRRMCQHLGYRVKKLKRIRIMNIKLKDIPEGRWRYLTKEELVKLRKHL